MRLPAPGAYRVGLEVAPQLGESVSANNRAEREIQVEKAKLRVLLAAQELDWEVGFIRRHLGGDPRIELSLLLPLFPAAPSIDPAAPPLAAPAETLLLFAEEEIESPTAAARRSPAPRRWTAGPLRRDRPVPARWHGRRRVRRATRQQVERVRPSWSWDGIAPSRPRATWERSCPPLSPRLPFLTS
ncbi:hypothetical protein HS125_07840 [bacterium]|nr:hypothetical protein [bacterium]